MRLRMEKIGSSTAPIEFESGRLLQAQILFLKGPELISVRGEVADAVERRHDEMRGHWLTMLHSLNVDTE